MMMPSLRAALLAVVWLWAGSAAAISGSFDRFITSLNGQLERWAAQSEVRLSYDDVERADEPLVGDYLAFKRVSFTYAAPSFTAKLRTREVVLRETEPGLYRLYLPDSGMLLLSSNQNEQKSCLRVAAHAAPKLFLRYDKTSLIFASYRLELPPSTRLEAQQLDLAVFCNQWEPLNGVEKVIRRGTWEIVRRGRIIGQWQPINPLSGPALVSALRALAEQVKAPDYSMQ